MDDEKSTQSNNYSFDTVEVTGLRSKRLLTLIVCLTILLVLTILLFVLNVMLISTLRMDPAGIKFLRFHHNLNKKSGQLEKTVEMAGDRIEFEKVISDKVVGFPNKDILLHAPRILVEAKPNDTMFAINEKNCKLENVNNFQVLNSQGHTLFSARHPTVTIDRKIKKISADKIITNKIRSAVDEPLKIDGNDVMIRGNEQVRIDARNIGFEAMTRIAFNISRDGILNVRGRVRVGDGTTSLPISTSPSLSASIDGLRLCACAQFNHKLFLVPANKQCNAHHSFCSA
ncbi:unnamed protein product [Caenorhabditis bovis]|uniref:Beta-sarcoglycan n=1 Tax=Caenorhabditis bovis TaxID=2654633 RepID=A0A8S1F2X4_9PELO|nr:unnamed protein product [Caenorhabditis bovis]